MATTVAKLEAILSADTSKFDKGMDQSHKTMGRVGKAAGVAGVAIAAGLGAGLVVAAVGMKRAIGDASNLNEQINKTKVVFGQSGDEVAQWSKGLARDFGLSSRQALEAAGNFGNMLVPMGFGRTEAAGMSQKMVELAGDLASFNNVPVPDALEKIRAGLAGESEPLRTMGVFLNDARIKAEAMAQGLYSGKGPLDASAKAAATYALILKDTKDAQGDFAKTNDGLANAQRSLSASWENISATLGMKLLPAFAGVASGAADFMDKLSKAEGAGAKFQVVMDTVKTIGNKAWESLKAGFNSINWGQVWDSVKTKLQSVDWGATARMIGDNLVKALNSVSTAISRVDWNKVGQAIGDGIKKGIGVLAQVDWGSLIVSYMKLQVRIINAIAKVLVAVGQSLLSGLLGVIQNAATSAGAWAAGIGSAVAQGIIAGIGDLASQFSGAIISKLSAAKDRVLGWAHIKSPSQLFASEVGSPIALGIALGVIQSGDKISEALQDKLEKAMERAKTVIESKRASFSAAWDTLAGAAGSAFDAIFEKIPTKHEKMIADLEAKNAAAARRLAISDAQTGLAEALAGGDPEAIKAAQRTLQEALDAQQVFAWQQLADKERLQLDAKIALRREKFLTQLTDLQAHLTKVGATEQQSHTAIMKLFAKYGIDYAKSGAALGEAFADGLRSKTRAVEAAAMALAEAASKPIKLHSPAEIGPLSQLDHYWDSFVPTLLAGLDTTGISSAISSAVAMPGGSRAGAGTYVPPAASQEGSGGGVNVNVYGDVTGQELVEKVRDALIQIGRRNSGGALGGFA